MRHGIQFSDTPVLTSSFARDSRTDPSPASLGEEAVADGSNGQSQYSLRQMLPTARFVADDDVVFRSMASSGGPRKSIPSGLVETITHEPCSCSWRVVELLADESLASRMQRVKVRKTRPSRPIPWLRRTTTAWELTTRKSTTRARVAL